ncbi:acetyl-CoA carboxylase carboxyltransferase subunit beta [Syntrophomonas curvata]
MSRPSYDLDHAKQYISKEKTIISIPQKSLRWRERIELLVDENSFQEHDSHLSSCNPLAFPDYEAKITKAAHDSSITEAIVTGNARIGGIPVELGVMESKFMMASMGSVVGEKVCRAIERAVINKHPLIISACSGGARMQEGIISLMQMAKTTSALSRLHHAGLLFVCIMTNPTTGGVLASFASQADIIIAESGALIGFTGPKVMQTAIGQQSHDDIQRSESLLEHGMVDIVVDNPQMRDTLIRLLRLH